MPYLRNKQDFNKVNLSLYNLCFIHDVNILDINTSPKYTDRNLEGDHLTRSGRTKLFKNLACQFCTVGTLQHVSAVIVNVRAVFVPTVALVEGVMIGR